MSRTYISSVNFRHTLAVALTTATVGLVACDSEFTGIGPDQLSPNQPANDHGTVTALQYTIAWDGASHTVTPVETTGTVEDFYAYDAVDGDALSANTGHEVSDAGTILLHRNTSTGHVSLVVIYDAANDGSGGSARVHLYGFSKGHPFPVRDDPGSTDPDDGYMRSGSGVYTLTHDWGASDTDGFAVRDGLESAFERQIWLRAATGLSSFRWVTGDGEAIEVPYGTNTRIDLSAEQVLVDQSVPNIVPTVTGTMGENGWYVSDVAVSWEVTDGQSAVETSGCDDVLITDDTDGLEITCEATSDGGTTSASVTIDRDATPPVVEFSGNAGTYSLDDWIEISCAASDAVSGLESADCDGLSAWAWSIGVGTMELTASATDNAGHKATESTSFEVVATAAGVCSLVEDWVEHGALAEALCVKLEQLGVSEARGHGNARDGQLGAFVNHVNALRGVVLTDEQADSLIELAGTL